MSRKILIAGAAIAALSIAACGKPADKAETTIETTTVEGSVDGGGSGSASGKGAYDDGSGGSTMSGGSGGGNANSGGGGANGAISGADTGSAPTMGSGVPAVDTSKGPATATTPTAKVPLETVRKNNPPPNQ